MKRIVRRMAAPLTIAALGLTIAGCSTEEPAAAPATDGMKGGAMEKDAMKGGDGKMSGAMEKDKMSGAMETDKMKDAPK